MTTMPHHFMIDIASQYMFLMYKMDILRAFLVAQC